MSTPDGPPAGPADLPPTLRGMVRSIDGWSERDAAPGMHRGLPSDTVTLIFAIGAPLRTTSSPRRWASGDLHSDSVVLGGLHTRPALVENPGTWAGVQVALHPLAARRILGVPTAALPVEEGWHPGELLGDDLESTLERLHRAGSWTERYRTVTSLLEHRWRRSQPGGVRAEVAEAWRLIHRSRGQAEVSVIADQVGLSRRRLSTLVGAELGVTPKTALRLTRFHRARHTVQRRAMRGQPLGLGEVAATGGYADQAHLAAEFREFAGLSPARWVRAEFPNLQAVPIGSAAECDP